MRDITDFIGEDDLPLCPLCDGPIEYAAELVLAFGMVCVAHGYCVDDSHAEAEELTHEQR